MVQPVSTLKTKANDGRGFSGMDTKFYTVREVMTMLKVSDETIYRWIRKGKLKAVRIGKDYRIHAGALEELLR